MSDALTKKPDLIPQQKWGDNRPRSTEMKESILKDVDALRIDKGRKSGGV
jgi:hypothetical protein